MRRSLLVAVVLLALCAASASAAPKVGFLGCRAFVSKHPVAFVEPKSIMVACGDGNFYVTGIRWTSWTATKATGTGTVHANDCTPNCAAGHFHTARGTVALSKPTRCKGSLAFSHLHVSSPPGDSDVDYGCP